jgi:hypothetical protein
VKGAYAVSLKSITLPVSWPNVTSVKTFDVEYGAVTPFPLDFVLPIGRYSYNLYQGLVDYTTVNATPADQMKDDLVYFLMEFWRSNCVHIH